MDTPKFDELAMLEQGPKVEWALWAENLPVQLGWGYVVWKARRAQVAAALKMLDEIPIDIDEAEANHPDIMWCHWCDTWRETGIDGGGLLYRRCIECAHEIQCDDCSQRVSAEGWCTTKGCPSNPLYST